MPRRCQSWKSNGTGFPIRRFQAILKGFSKQALALSEFNLQKLWK